MLKPNKMNLKRIFNTRNRRGKLKNIAAVNTWI